MGNMVVEEMSAVVLAGGLGTRLQTVVSDRPKSMAEIAGTPFLEYLIAWLAAFGIKEVVLCVGYKSEAIHDWLIASALPLHVRVSQEVKPLGTAGALKQAEPFLNRGTFLVLNGDSILDVDVPTLVADHARHRATATIALGRSNEVGRYGRVLLDRAGRVTAFAEKQAVISRPDGPEWINGGIYVFEHEVFDLIPAAPPAVSIETELFPSLIGCGLYGFPSDGYFIDIGVPKDYQTAQKELPRRFGRVHAHSR